MYDYFHKQHKTIGVIGSRTRNTKQDKEKVFDAIDVFCRDGDWLCSGGCNSGADAFAEEYAKKNGIPLLVFYPNWDVFGKAAGPIRNKKIAEFSDILIACWDGESKGTLSTIDYFKSIHSDWIDKLWIV